MENWVVREYSCEAVFPKGRVVAYVSRGYSKEDIDAVVWKVSLFFHPRASRRRSRCWFFDREHTLHEEAMGAADAYARSIAKGRMPPGGEPLRG